MLKSSGWLLKVGALCGLTLLTGLTAFAQATPGKLSVSAGPIGEVLPGPTLGDSHWSVVGETEGLVKSEKEVADLPGNPQALRLTILKTGENYWNIQFAQETPRALPTGDVLRFHFWGRSKTHNPLNAVFEHNGNPYEKFLDAPLSLSPQWKEYALVFTLPRDIPANWSGLRFQIGYRAGEIELARISLEEWGVQPSPLPTSINALGDPFDNGTLSPGWWKDAAQRIDAIRKGNLVVRVVNASGKPVPGASVQVIQTRHKFRFGTAIAPTPLFDTGADGQHYRETILKLFNCVVLENALKWQTQDYDTPETADRMIAWCEAHHLPVRGHNLLWPKQEYLPRSVQGLHGDALRDAIHNHITEYVKRYRGRVYVWDVINEAVANTYVQKELGDSILVDAFKWAREADPTVRLAYNDYDLSNNKDGANDKHLASVLALVRSLLDAGAPVNSLGDQSHMSAPLTHGDKLWTIWDSYGQFKLPIEVTEYDATLPDDAVHAAYLKEFLTAAFSHPAIDSFVMWGFWANAHWLGDQGGAMFRKDWTPRPAVGTYEDLVFHQWWTHATEATNASGNAKLRVFLGEHQLIVTHNGHTVHKAIAVEEGGNSVTTVQIVLQ